MKILAFGDSHGSMKALKQLKEKAKKADLIICIGDVTVFEQNFRGVMKDLDGLGKPILMIHGNHEEEDTMQKQCEDTKNIIFAHEALVEVDDVIFSGFGGGGFSVTDKWMKAYYQTVKGKLSGKKWIFLTHAPPVHTTLDNVHGADAGCKTVRDVIEKLQPEYAFAGHLHENFGKKDKIKKTICVNPGPFGMFFDI
jgi:Icc-related predicted phosphoesterase